MIDTHCHLEKAILSGREAEVLARMEAAGVGRCITVGTSQKDWELYFRLAARERHRVDWTVGLHPGCIGEDWEEQLKAIPTYFGTEPRPVALGEMGLDWFHLSRFPDEAAEQRQLQERVFREQLALAYQLDCPVVIHSRDAVAECIRLIDQSGVDWRRVVFHCFTGTPAQLREINRRGGRASFTGILTYPAKSADPVRQAACEQGLERLMLETDAPYLAPQPVRGQPCEPAHVAHVAACAAGLLGVSLETLAGFTTRNAREFFGIEPA